MLLYINNNKVLQVQEDNCDYDDETWRRWGSVFDMVLGFVRFQTSEVDV